jgi:opacity protein-like surface antigen
MFGNLIGAACTNLYNFTASTKTHGVRRGAKPAVARSHQKKNEPEDMGITTYSASYVAGGDATAGGWKPFGAVGVSLMRASVTDDTENKFAFNLGGGIVALFSERLGVRGEVRYFRRLEDDEEGLIPVPDVFDYWKVAGGVVLRF